jgi:site-specific DNA-methyltransferase (adenine-specific)
MMAAAATVSVRWRAATSISGSEVWRTPEALFRALHQEFDFTLDVAADDGNAVVDRYLTHDADALTQSWAGERVFCNPPYGRILDRWLAKAITEAQDRGALVVMVLPARTGNAWFHRYVLPHAEVRFIRGRLNFTIGGGGRKNAPFDSMVVIFRPFQAGGGTIAAQPTFPGFSRRS